MSNDLEVVGWGKLVRGSDGRLKVLESTIQNEAPGSVGRDDDQVWIDHDNDPRDDDSIQRLAAKWNRISDDIDEAVEAGNERKADRLRRQRGNVVDKLQKKGASLERIGSDRTTAIRNGTYKRPMGLSESEHRDAALATQGLSATRGRDGILRLGGQIQGRNKMITAVNGIEAPYKLVVTLNSSAAGEVTGDVKTSKPTRVAYITLQTDDAAGLVTTLTFHGDQYISGGGVEPGVYAANAPNFTVYDEAIDNSQNAGKIGYTFSAGSKKATFTFHCTDPFGTSCG